MGFVKNTNKYGIQVFLTNAGLEKLFDIQGNGGIKTNVAYFTLGSSEGDYRAYMNANDMPLEFNTANGNFNEGYYVNPEDGTTVIINSQNRITDLTGRTEQGVFRDKQIFRTSESTIGEVIIFQPDFDTYQTYNFDSFKENTDNVERKFFNLGLYGYPSYPVIIGEANMYNSTNNTKGLVHQEDKILGYVETNEPTSISNLIAKNTNTNISNNYPFPGVGVSAADHAKTEYQKFQILNKSSQPIYLYDYKITDLKASKSHKITKAELLSDGTSGSTNYILEYTIVWNDLIGIEREDGKLRIKADKDFLTKAKSVILPFETINFWVQYEVSPNLLGEYDPNQHYHGQSSDNKNKKEGQLNFNFQIRGSKTKLVANTAPATEDLLTTDIGVIVQVKDDTKEETGFNKISCQFYNGIGSPCSSTYSDFTVYADTTEDIKTTATTGGKLYARHSKTSVLAQSGYYKDANSVTNETYYWDFTTGKFDTTKSYTCEVYHSISVYYSPISNNIGDFSSYVPKTIYISGNDTTLENLCTNNNSLVYTDDYQKTVIEDGYYVTSLTKTVDTHVYNFNKANTTKWVKTAMIVPTASSVYYKAKSSGDACDTRTGKYAATTIYSNPQGQTSGTKYYKDVNNTQLADYGYYVFAGDYASRPFNAYDFEGAPLLTPAITCSTLTQLSNVYYSATANGTYDPVVVWCGRSGISTISNASTSNVLLFTTSGATTVIASGYYRTGNNATPFTTYQFNSETETWVGSTDVLTSASVYFYTGNGDQREDYTNYESRTVYISANATSISDALSGTGKTIYANYSGTVNVDNGYYTAINPTGGHSFTYCEYVGGVKSSIYYKLEKLRINNGIGYDPVVYYTEPDTENTACYGAYESKIVYAYLVNSSPELTYEYNSTPNAYTLKLYKDNAGTVEADAGFYAVPSSLTNVLTDEGKINGSYRYYYYNAYTHQMTTNHLCEQKIAEVPITGFIMANNSVKPTQITANNDNTVYISIDGSTKTMKSGMPFTISGSEHVELNGDWVIDEVVGLQTFTFQHIDSLNFDYTPINDVIKINSGCYYDGYTLGEYYTTSPVVSFFDLITKNQAIYIDMFGHYKPESTYFMLSNTTYNWGKAFHGIKYDAETNSWTSDMVVCTNQPSSGSTDTYVTVPLLSRTVADEYDIDEEGNWFKTGNTGTMSSDYFITNGEDPGVLNDNNVWVYGGSLDYYQEETIVKYDPVNIGDPVKTLKEMYETNVQLTRYDGQVVQTGVYVESLTGVIYWYFWDADLYNTTNNGWTDIHGTL